MKGNLANPSAGNKDFYDNLLEHVEVPRLQIELCHDLTLIHAKATRKVTQLNSQQQCVGTIQDGAQNPAANSHVGATRGHIARGYEQIRFLALFPKIFEEL